MTKKEIIKEVKFIDSCIKILEKEKEQYFKELVKLICPYVPGDIAICRDYTHNRKDVLIKKIYITKRYYRKKLIWNVRGIVLNKNDIETHYHAHWDQRQEEEYIKERKKKGE